MADDANVLLIRGDRASEALADARARLEQSGDGLRLDFSAVTRLDAAALRELERIVACAGARGKAVELQHVPVGVHKVITLMGLRGSLSY